MLHEGKIASSSGTPDEIIAAQHAVRARVRRDVGHRARSEATTLTATSATRRGQSKPTSASRSRSASPRSRSRSSASSAFASSPRARPADTVSRLVACFHDATGLVESRGVQIAGLRIGEVDRSPPRRALREGHIRVKPETPLWSNATVFKKAASLLGEYYLEIDPGTAESPDPMTGQDAEEPSAQGRRSDPERRRGVRPPTSWSRSNRRCRCCARSCRTCAS